MTTYHELKAAQRKAKREEFKQIEASLHPCPKIEGYDILHEHKGQKIIFSAWQGADRLNSYFIEYERWYVLFSKDFYKEEIENLKMLVKP